MAARIEEQECEPWMTDAPVRFPSSVVLDSRSSSVASVQAEPLTLDEDELQDAKVRKELALSAEESAKALSSKINELVEKADQVLEANKLSNEALARIPGTAAAQEAAHGGGETPDNLSTSDLQNQDKSVATDHPHSD
eukprot:TRINITY_DN1555_c0_g1_i3.p1 TRINITY_DN1555_c0_g1~~TRINITY_DN1555_c0_g1_i3.p1  ORF type:complete len:138 (+),score=28.60 TRINITY_DN1555_c0_g1_i3:44-457(+)